MVWCNDISPRCFLQSNTMNMKHLRHFCWFDAGNAQTHKQMNSIRSWKRGKCMQINNNGVPNLCPHSFHELASSYKLNISQTQSPFDLISEAYNCDILIMGALVPIYIWWLRCVCLCVCVRAFLFECSACVLYLMMRADAWAELGSRSLAM